MLHSLTLLKRSSLILILANGHWAVMLCSWEVAARCKFIIVLAVHRGLKVLFE